MSNKYNGHEYVDLDLPSGLLWATCNVGAMNPEDYGRYYSWGEIQHKDDYSWNSYKWCQGSGNTLSKYCTDSNLGKEDSLMKLERVDDIASVKWGKPWRMPTMAEFQELRRYCNWDIDEDYNGTGKTVYIISSKLDRFKFIILPFAGSFEEQVFDSLIPDNVNMDYYYWSSDLDPEDSRQALCFGDECVSFYGYRYFGNSVRPVLKMPNRRK